MAGFSFEELVMVVVPGTPSLIKVTTASLNFICDLVHSDNIGMRVAFKILISVVLFHLFFSNRQR